MSTKSYATRRIAIHIFDQLVQDQALDSELDDNTDVAHNMGHIILIIEKALIEGLSCLRCHDADIDTLHNLIDDQYHDVHTKADAS